MRSPDIGLVILAGTVSITGSTGATTADTLTYASASCTATGIYRITLEDSYVSLKACHLTTESTGSQNLRPVLSGSSVGSGKYVDFMLLTGSTGLPAKPQTDNTNVHVTLFLKNSNV